MPRVLQREKARTLRSGESGKLAFLAEPAALAAGPHGGNFLEIVGIAFSGLQAALCTQRHGRIDGGQRSNKAQRRVQGFTSASNGRVRILDRRQNQIGLVNQPLQCLEIADGIGLAMQRS